MEATTNNYISKSGIPFRNIIESNTFLSWLFTAFISHPNPPTKPIERGPKSYQIFQRMRRT